MSPALPWATYRQKRKECERRLAQRIETLPKTYLIHGSQSLRDIARNNPPRRWPKPGDLGDCFIKFFACDLQAYTERLKSVKNRHNAAKALILHTRELMEHCEKYWDPVIADYPLDHPDRQKDAWESVKARVWTLMLEVHLDEFLTKGTLNYRSELKGAIRLDLTLKPRASDMEVCRWLDEQGVECKYGRSFEAAYRQGTNKQKIETAISKVRADMRQHGLLG